MTVLVAVVVVVLIALSLGREGLKEAASVAFLALLCGIGGAILAIWLLIQILRWLFR